MSKISELSNGGALLSTDDLIVVRSGGNVRAQLSSLNGIAIGSSTPAAGSFTTLTTTGKAGFGTASPSSYYAKNLVVMADGDGTGGITIAAPATDDNTYLAFADGTSGAAAYAGYVGYSHSSEYLFLGGGAETTMYVQGKTRVGIGGAPNANWRNDSTDRILTLGTEAALHSDAGVTTELWNNAYVDNSDTFKNISTRGASRYMQYSGAHKWFTAASASAGSTISTEINSSPKMVLNADGNLGIAITNPTEKFTVVNSSSGIVGRFTNNTNQTLDLGVISGSGAAGGVYYNSANSGYHAFQVGGSEAMRITSARALEFKGASTTTNAQAFITNDNSTLTIGSSVSGSVVKDIHFNSPSTMMVIDGSSGNVGIGVSNPSSYTAGGNDLVVGGSGSHGITVVSGTGSTGNLFFADSTSGNAAYRGYVQYQHASDKLVLGTASDDRVFIDSNGSITMNGAAGTSPIFEMINNDNEDNDTGRETSIRFSGHRSGGEDVINAQISAHHDGSADDDKGMLFFYTNNGTGLNLAQKIDSSGNLVVGDSSATFNDTAKTVIRPSADNWVIKPAVCTAFNRSGSDGDILEFYRGASSKVGSIGVANGDLNIDGDTGIRFQSSSLMPRSGGSDADATVDLGLSSHRWKDLFLSGIANIGGTAKFASWSNSGASNGIEIRSTDGQILNSHTGTGLHVYQYFYNANGVVGSISASGSSTAFNTSSDYRLKENVVAMSGATERLKKLLPKQFNFIADADTTIDGFLAHEVADVVPEAITGTKDGMRDEQYEVTPAVFDDDGHVVAEAVMETRSVPDYQGIDQSKLVPLLVATIQELEARITQLEDN